MSKVAVLPSPGHSFSTYFSEWNSHLGIQRVKSSDFLVKQEIERLGYEVVEARNVGSALADDVIAVVHCSQIGYKLIASNPHIIHILKYMEPISLHFKRSEIAILKKLFDAVIFCELEMPDDQERIFKLPGYENLEVDFQGPKPLNRPLLLAAVFSDKSSDAQMELYSKRREVITWFEQNVPGQLVFGGQGWGPEFQVYQTYRGSVDAKLDFFAQAKFALCFENSRDEYNAVSEKIFHAMYAGSVPVYWGRRTLDPYLPKNLYIDYTDFGTPEKLYQHISSMSLDEIDEYRQRIQEWISSDQAKVFSCLRWAECIDEIIRRGKQVYPSKPFCIYALWRARILARIRILLTFKRKFACNKKETSVRKTIEENSDFDY